MKISDIEKTKSIGVLHLSEQDADSVETASIIGVSHTESVQAGFGACTIRGCSCKGWRGRPEDHWTWCIDCGHTFGEHGGPRY